MLGPQYPGNVNRAPAANLNRVSGIEQGIFLPSGLVPLSVPACKPPIRFEVM